MRRGLIAAIAVAMTVAVSFGAAPAPAASQTVADHQDPMAGRWSGDALAEAVSRPIAIVESGDMARGEQAFERLLAEVGDDPEERCRLLTAFGISLMNLFDSDADPVKYMRRAVDEARRAFPAESRMLAMALADYAIVELETRDEGASAEAEAALVEALGIRSRLLGPWHIETLVASTTLGKIRGAPARTAGSPAKVIEAARYFAPLLRAQPLDDPEDTIDHLFLEWTAMLIDNRRPDMACKVLEALPDVDPRLHLNLDYIGLHVGLQLQEAGFDGEAAPLVKESRWQDNPVAALLGDLPSTRATGAAPECGPA